MSSGNPFERLWKLQASINKLVLDGKRDPEMVADVLQTIVDEPAVLPPAQSVEKFAEFVDLGIVTVPNDYDHATCLTAFRQRHQGGEEKSFRYYNDAITDPNFSNPSRILKPGDKFRVKAYRQVVGGTTTSEERMAFLRRQKTIFTGAQGATLVFDQKRDQLPKGKWYASFDEPNRLWKDADGYRKVPYVRADSDSDFWFNLGYFENVWDDYIAFLGFCDLEPPQPLAA